MGGPAEPAALDILASRPRLLIVDDQPINIQALYQAFQADHEVFMATSGEQALDFCRRDPPDLILLDVMMPEMDGLEVCRRLKADAATADIPVIFVTAQEDPADETRALEAGGVDFIVKPVNRAVVRARVRTHLTLKAQTDLLRSLAFIDGPAGAARKAEVMRQAVLALNIPHATSSVATTVTISLSVATCACNGNGSADKLLAAADAALYAAKTGGRNRVCEATVDKQ